MRNEAHFPNFQNLPNFIGHLLHTAVNCGTCLQLEGISQELNILCLEFTSVLFTEYKLLVTSAGFLTSC